MQNITAHPPVEARRWLCRNSSRHALATNRFHEKKNALAFGDMLHAAIASEVLVDDAGADVDELPCADTLLVPFPTDGDARRALARL